MSGTPEIALVYVAFQPYGPEPFLSFVESYRRHAGGLPHRLVVAFKGFAAEAQLSEYKQHLAGIAYSPLRVADEGYDIGTYLLAASRIPSRFYCFLNTRSIILA